MGGYALFSKHKRTWTTRIHILFVFIDGCRDKNVTWLSVFALPFISNTVGYVTTSYLWNEAVGLFCFVAEGCSPLLQNINFFFSVLVLIFSPSILLPTSGPHWPTGRPLWKAWAISGFIWICCYFGLLPSEYLQYANSVMTWCQHKQNPVSTYRRVSMLISWNIRVQEHFRRCTDVGNLSVW